MTLLPVEERGSTRYTCWDCERVIDGVVYRFYRKVTVCAACVPEHIRRRVPVPCASCGRDVVIVMPDRRFARIFCSVTCAHDHRRRCRAAAHEPVACAQCGSWFVPTRRDAKYCCGRCRVAALRARRRA